MGFLAPLASAAFAAVVSATAVTAYTTLAISFGINWAVNALTKKKEVQSSGSRSGDKKIGPLYSFSGYETQVDPRSRIGILYGTTRASLQRIIAYVSGIACQQRDIVSAVYGVCEGEIDTNSSFDVFVNDKNYDDLDVIDQGTVSPINSKTLKLGTNNQTALPQATNYKSTFFNGLIVNPYRTYRGKIVEHCYINSANATANYSEEAKVSQSGSNHKRIIAKFDMSGFNPTGSVRILETSIYAKFTDNSSSGMVAPEIYTMKDPITGSDTIDTSAATWNTYDGSNVWPSGAGAINDRLNSTNWNGSGAGQFTTSETSGYRKWRLQSSGGIFAGEELNSQNGWLMITSGLDGTDMTFDFSEAFIEIFYAPEDHLNSGSASDDPEYVTSTYGSDVTSLSIGLSAPSGIYEISGSGVSQGYVVFSVGYSIHDADSWTEEIHVLYGNSSNPLKIVLDLFSGASPNQWDIRIKPLSYAMAAGMYGSANPPLLSSTRLQTLRIEYVNEGRELTHKFPNTALLGLDLEASEQVSGGLPNVSAVLDGLKVRVYTDTTSYSTSHSSNPSWCALDFITNTRYGLGISHDSVDIQSFLDFADFCTDNSFSCDYFTQKTSGRDILDDILYPNRAFISESVDGVKVFWDRPQTSTAWKFFQQTSTQRGNIEELVVNMTPNRDKATRATCEFLNELNNYETDHVSYEDLTAISTEGVKELTASLASVTSKTHAESFAEYLLKKQRLSDIMVTFKTHHGSVMIEPMDLIEITHDLGSTSWSSKKFLVAEVSKSNDPTNMTVIAVNYDSDIYP